MRLNERVALGIGLEVIGCFHERDSGSIGEHLGNAGTEFWMRVDTAPNRGAANR